MIKFLMAILLSASILLAQDTTSGGAAIQQERTIIALRLDSIETTCQLKALEIHSKIIQLRDSVKSYGNSLDSVSKKILDYTVSTFTRKNSAKLINMQNSSIEILQKKNHFEHQKDSLSNCFNTNYPIYSKLFLLDSIVKYEHSEPNSKRKIKVKLKILGSTMIATGIAGAVLTIVDAHSRKEFNYYGREANKWEKMHTTMVILSGGLVLSGTIAITF